jgi:uncharacterized repeat protein (TIGR03803 family)
MSNRRLNGSVARFLPLASALLFAVMATPFTYAQTLTTLYNFGGYQGDGAYPRTNLVLDFQGNLYGTTLDGGAGLGNDFGTVFMLTPSGTETVLYSFAHHADASPGQLVVGPDANVYVPTLGGDNEEKIVELKKPSFKKAKVILSFKKPWLMGFDPRTLIPNGEGQVWGTTSAGGAYGFGTIFEVTQPKKISVLHNFAGSPTEGEFPFALIADGQGNFYGTSWAGGEFGSYYAGGTVFKLAADGTFTTLYHFCAQSGCADGEYPNQYLIFDGEGNLYGTTWAGGTYDVGTVFEVTAAGTCRVLYSFTEGADGGGPDGGVVMDGSRNLYGTTSFGGSHGKGTVFELSSSGKLTMLHSFAGRDGSEPEAGIILDGQGNLYGTTSGGGAYGYGTVFKITP